MLLFSLQLIKDRDLQHKFNREKLGFSEYNRNFKFTSLKNFLGLLKNKAGKSIRSIHICHLWVLTGFSAESDKILCLGKFLNECKVTYKKKRNLDVDAFREEGKRFKSQIRLIIISRDC